MQAALAGLVIYHYLFSDIKTYTLLTVVTMTSSLIYSSDSSSHIIKIIVLTSDVNSIVVRIPNI